MTLNDLAKWLRERQAGFIAAGQTNEIANNLGETAAFLEAYIDLDNGTTRKAKLQAATVQHNSMLVTRCTERRANATTPCGGSPGVRCPDCPRTLGLTAGNRTIPG